MGFVIVAIPYKGIMMITYEKDTPDKCLFLSKI